MPVIYFTPNAGYIGDAGNFTFQVSDGICSASQSPSAGYPVTATVTIQVKEVNHAPTCANISASVASGGSVAMNLIGSDADKDAISYIITKNPIAPYSLADSLWDCRRMS